MNLGNFQNYIFEDNPIIAVAVSGGIDSMCLVHLLADWVNQVGGKLIAFTVDHGLRVESSREAQKVQLWLNDLGVEHHILKWEGIKPEVGIQQAARNARYDLLLSECKKRGILHLAVAHHYQDQVETHLIRKQMHSGPIGLAGMSEIMELDFVRIIRPLLQVSKQDIIDFMQGKQWIDDPSNENEKFTRVAIRKKIDHHKINMEPFKSKRLDIEQKRNRFLAEHFTLHPLGFGYLALDTASKLNADTLAAILMCIGGKEYAPRGRYLKNILSSFDRAKTCWGCYIFPHKGNLFFCREPGNIADNKIVNGIWDRRFKVNDQVKPIGKLGWRQVREKMRDENLPAVVYWSLPAVWSGDKIITVPELIFRPKRQLCSPLFL